jgi:dimethylglycine dehydrogenase
MLNRRGRIELETTIVRMARGPLLPRLRGLLRTAPARPSRLSIAMGPDVTVTTALGLGGAGAERDRRRATSWRLHRCAARQCAFRWLSAQEIEIAGHRSGPSACPMRANWAGSCTCPRGDADRLRRALGGGEAHGIADYGSFAMNVMRMEKGFKGAGELTNEVTLPRPT